MIEIFKSLAEWVNSNEGVLALVLFIFTAISAWLSGILSALRRKPKLRITLIDGPSFSCTFGTCSKHNEYDVHRTGIALYLKISNVGSASTSIDSVSIGYHWAIIPFKSLWWRYGIGWFWLREQAVSLTDFQVNIGENVKFYPFLTQRSTISGHSAETFLEIGKMTNGVAYFEQSDSFGACFPKAKNKRVLIKIKIIDSFGFSYIKKISIPVFTLDEARKYNPNFGLTLSSLRNETAVISLEADVHGNIIPR